MQILVLKIPKYKILYSTLRDLQGGGKKYLSLQK